MDKSPVTPSDQEEIIAAPSYRTWTRHQVIPCLLIYVGIICQNLCLTMVGPGLLDLQLVTHTSVQQASWFLSARAAGSLVGSIILSKTMETQYYWFQLSAALILFGVAFIIIPWVANFPAVIVLFVIMGFGMGYFLTGGLLSLYHMWNDRKDSVSWINGGQLMHMIGGIAGPLIVRPFFAPQAQSDRNINGTILSYSASTFNNILSNEAVQPTPKSNNSSTTMHYSSSIGAVNNVNINLNSTIEPSSINDNNTHIMYAFLIGGLIVIITGFSFILLYFKIDKIKIEERKSFENAQRRKIKHLLLKFIIVIFLLMFNVMISVLMRTFAEYIVTFTVNYMNWTKQKGSLLTSILFIELFISKIFCIFLVRVIKTEIQLFIGCLINIFGAGLLLFLIEKDENVIWVCTCIIVIGNSNIIATIFPWTDKYIGLYGFIGALHNIGGTIGEVITIPLIGWLFEDISYKSFLYLIFISTIAMLVFMIMLQIMGGWYRALMKGYEETNDEYPLLSKSKQK